jgi:hypothetical protein
MPKALCITALVMSILVFILFAADLIMGLAGNLELAPFKYTSLVLDIVFVICAGGIGFLSWQTFREQV